MNNNFQKVLQILKEKGYTKEQIDKVKDVLTKAAAAKLEEQMIKSLTTQDMEIIEKLDEKDSLPKIKELYELKTGKKAEDFALEFYTNFANAFIQVLEKDKN
ncbi:hypothetical protein HYT02_04215 [Candidatus Gottesmanbacteria bacterium]|nr:hypothetical protein [Candidatus Gottesmanbacteria bacterium]